MQRPKLVRPTHTQATWKTIRGMIAKNIFATLLVGHPMGLVENVIHGGVDWLVNKYFCTNNKLLNVGVHLATCLSVDSVLHGGGHEILESAVLHGHSHGVDIVDVDYTDVSDTSDFVVDDDQSGSTDVEQGVESESQPTVNDLAKQGGIWAKLQQAHQESVGVAEHFEGDGHDHGSDLSHNHHSEHNHIHEGHDHGHGEHDHGHGLLPILGGAIVEEYGPTRYKITKRKTTTLVHDLFGWDAGDDVSYVKKSDVDRSMKSRGKVMKFDPNIIKETQKQGDKLGMYGVKQSA